ncbi:hypothetical protein BT69DRAFT_559277 [Atractiella rhizophila]|nr:hypothetical protein BT69DRAFT_559277 [Atractiella rhizophila]
MAGIPPPRDMFHTSRFGETMPTAPASPLHDNAPHSSPSFPSVDLRPPCNSTSPFPHIIGGFNPASNFVPSPPSFLAETPTFNPTSPFNKPILHPPFSHGTPPSFPPQTFPPSRGSPAGKGRPSGMMGDGPDPATSVVCQISRAVFEAHRYLIFRIRECSVDDFLNGRKAELEDLLKISEGKVELELKKLIGILEPLSQVCLSSFYETTMTMFLSRSVIGSRPL